MSKSSNRMTQHKAKRETASPQKELRAVKQENKSLRRQLSKLRKQMGRALQYNAEVQAAFGDETETLATEGPGPGACMACGATSENVVSFQIPGGNTVLSVCKKCGHKEKTVKP